MDAAMDGRSEGSSSTPNVPQKRSRQACEECRVRKRKCDGKLPSCELCMRRGIRCEYATEMRKRGRRLQTVSARSVSEEAGLTASTHSTRQGSPFDQIESSTRRMEANSGLAWPQLLSRRIENSHDAYRTRFQSWNLGLLPKMSMRHVSEVIPEEEILRFTAVYERTVHQICSILDMGQIRSKIREKWDRVKESVYDDYDAIISIVGALGSLFSGGSAYEADLVDCARHQLDDNMLTNIPTSEHIDARILRTFYLRTTAGPQASWLESSMVMLLFESIGAHQLYMSSILQPNVSCYDNRDHNIKSYWTARMLNSWTAYEFGRPRITRRNHSNYSPAAMFDLPPDNILIERAETDLTWELLRLYRMSERLDPGESDDNVNLTQLLRAFVDFEAHCDIITALRTNSVLMVYRRLRLIKMHVTQEVENLVISSGCQGVEACVRLASRREPWALILNVPFQFFCILLIMDSKESMTHVKQATRAIEHIARTFRSPCAIEVHNTTAFLLRLFQKKMQDDLDHLKQMMTTEMDVPDYISTTLPQFQDFGGLTSAFEQPTMAPTSAGMSVPIQSDINWQDIDWNLFLGAAGNYHV